MFSDRSTVLTAANCVEFSRDKINTTSLQPFELLSFKSRSNDSRIVVYVGIHNTAEQSVNNAYLVKQIIIVR